MAANEFEKNVQKTMDEFTLHPSGEVWQNVEKRIRERKRSRRIFFFVIFLFLGLALAGYGVYDFSNRQKLTSEPENGKADESSQVTGNKKQGTTIPEKSGINNDLVKADTETTNKKAVSSKSNYDKEIVKKSITKNDDFVLMKENNVRINAASEKNKKRQDENSFSDTVSRNLPGDVSVINKRNDPASQKIISTQPGDSIAKNSPRDTTSTKGEETKTGLALVQVKRREKRDPAFANLKWGLNFSIGSSTITQNRFSLKDIGNVNTNYSNSPGTSPGGATGFQNVQSSTRSSLAFKAGLTMKKIVSRRSSLLMSIDYTYLADNIRVGDRRNSTPQPGGSYDVSSYYAGPPQRTFKDRFHFIELPFIYDWRITGHTKHFLSFSVGTSVSYLVSTNALIYDTISAGIYYHKKDLFNKLHVNLLSGLAYHVTGAKNMELNVGPQFSFDINDIFKKDLDRRKYFLYAGIGATLFFEKKRR